MGRPARVSIYASIFPSFFCLFRSVVRGSPRSWRAHRVLKRPRDTHWNRRGIDGVLESHGRVYGAHTIRNERGWHPSFDAFPPVQATRFLILDLSRLWSRPRYRLCIQTRGTRVAVRGSLSACLCSSAWRMPASCDSCVCVSVSLVCVSLLCVRLYCVPWTVSRFTRQ
jgi:hypothetical protein